MPEPIDDARKRDPLAQRRHDAAYAALAHAWFAPIGLGDLGQLADDLLVRLAEIDESAAVAR